jgi:hypothetical protein
VINRNWPGWPEWRFGGLRTAKEHALSSARSIIARFRGKSSDILRLFLRAAGHFIAPCSGEPLFEVIMRRYENRSALMTSNRPLEEWGKLLGDVPTAGAIRDRFLHHAQTIAITGRSYRLKDHAAIPGKEDKNKKGKSKPNDPGFAEARPSTAKPAS